MKVFFVKSVHRLHILAIKNFLIQHQKNFEGAKRNSILWD